MPTIDLYLLLPQPPLPPSSPARIFKGITCQAVLDGDEVWGHSALTCGLHLVQTGSPIDVSQTGHRIISSFLITEMI